MLAPESQDFYCSVPQGYFVIILIHLQQRDFTVFTEEDFWAPGLDVQGRVGTPISKIPEMWRVPKS